MTFSNLPDPEGYLLIMDHYKPMAFYYATMIYVFEGDQKNCSRQKRWSREGARISLHIQTES